MTKLSSIRIDPEEDERGQWLYFGEDVYLRIRRTTYAPFRRAMRRIMLEREGRAAAPDLDQRLTLEEQEEEALHAARGEHLIADCYGWDADSEPVALNGEAKREEVGVSGDGTKLEVWRANGKSYRKVSEGDGEATYQELVQWTPELSAQVMRDSGHMLLREWVKRWSDIITVAGIQKVSALLGKSRTQDRKSVV